MADIPQQRLDQIRNLVNLWEPLVGFSVPVPDWMVQEMAGTASYGDLGHAVNSIYDVGRYMSGHVTDGANDGAHPVTAEVYKNMPWAFYGLKPAEYESQVSTYATQYKRLTGQDISQDALQDAFKSVKDVTGGMLSGSEYAQRLSSDADIQKTYGWVKYGLDYQQWQTQKLHMQGQFGREVQDQEAAVLLQYNHENAGPMGRIIPARAAVPGVDTPTPTKQPGVAGSGSIAR